MRFVFFLLILSVGMAQAEYRMVLFGYGENEPASQSHSFASFYRVGEEGVQDVITISWLPCQVAISKLAKQSGCNFSLEATLKIRGRRSVGYSAPIEIPEGLYKMAEWRVKNLLRSDRTWYKMLDDITRRGDRFRWLTLHNRSGGWSNCIHAISDTGGSDMPNVRMWGERTAPRILNHLARTWRFSVPARMSMTRTQASKLKVSEVLR